MSITIGLGLGADQAKIIIVAFLLISVVIVLKSFRKDNNIDDSSLFITISSKDTISVQLPAIIAILKKHSISVKLKRYDEGEKFIEVVFYLSFSTIENLTSVKMELQELDKAMEINVLDQEGIII